MARRKTKTAIALQKMEKEYKCFNVVKPKIFTCKVSSVRVNRQETRIKALENGELPDDRINNLNGGSGFTNLGSPLRKGGMHC